MAIKFKGFDFIQFDSLLSDEELMVRDTAHEQARPAAPKAPGYSRSPACATNSCAGTRDTRRNWKTPGSPWSSTKPPARNAARWPPMPGQADPANLMRPVQPMARKATNSRQAKQLACPSATAEGGVPPSCPEIDRTFSGCAKRRFGLIPVR